MVQIRCKNNNLTKSFPEGSSLLDIYQAFAQEIDLPYPVVSAKVNNVSQGLKYRAFQNRDVEFLDARRTCSLVRNFLSNIHSAEDIIVTSRKKATNH